VPLVGEAQRARAVRQLQRAYAESYLEPPELEHRLAQALRARTAAQLGMSVRGIPGAVTELVVQGFAVPAMRYGTFGARLWIARLLVRVAFGGWAVATAVLAAVAAVTALMAGLSAGVGVALALVWLAATIAAFGLLRAARLISRP
jgi:hypothetical protein